VTYVAIGASDAVGVGAGDPATESWPAVLDTLLPQGSKLIDLGVPSITLARALDVELPVALDALPPRPTIIRNMPGGRDVVTVWLAANDLRAGVTLASYAANLDTMLRALHARTDATVLVGNLPDLAAVPAFQGQGSALAATVRAWNGAIAAIARRNGATLVDLYAGWRELAAHPEYVGPDGLHPSAAGYRRLAQLFYQGLAGRGR
jgi:acyl-CoA thioesterase-1